MGWKDSLCSSLHIWCFSELSLSRVGEQLSPGVPWNLEQSDQLERRCQRHCLSQQNRGTPISFLHLGTQQRCLATLAVDRPPYLEVDTSRQVNSERSSQEVKVVRRSPGKLAAGGRGLLPGMALLPQSEWAGEVINCFVTNWHHQQSRNYHRWGWSFICGR